MKMLQMLFLIVLATIVFSNTLNAVTYDPLPNWPHYRGFYHCLDMANYKNLLTEDMPYQVQRGYILTDSLDKALLNNWYNPVKKMNLHSDTARNIQKYWCHMNDFDPVRFYGFLCRKNPVTKNNFRSIQAKLRERMERDGNDKVTYVYPSYILHIYVNERIWIDTSDIKHPNHSSVTIAYCKVLDTLKGKVFPSLDDAIIYNGELSEDLMTTYTAVPLQTDVVFRFRHSWTRGYNDGWGRTLGWHWVKPDKEYIVFLEFRGADAIGCWDPVGSVHKEYYSLMPYWAPKSCSMYPIEDGYVLDENNALGFGKKVPVDVFKQNIRNKINEIKNYGDY